VKKKAIWTKKAHSPNRPLTSARDAKPEKKKAPTDPGEKTAVLQDRICETSPKGVDQKRLSIRQLDGGKRRGNDFSLRWVFFAEEEEIRHKKKKRIVSSIKKEGEEGAVGKRCRPRIARKQQPRMIMKYKGGGRHTDLGEKGAGHRLS